MKLKFLSVTLLTIFLSIQQASAEPVFLGDNYQLRELGAFPTIATLLNQLQGQWYGKVQVTEVRDGAPFVSLDGDVELTVSLESPHIWLQSEKTCVGEDQRDECQT